MDDSKNSKHYLSSSEFFYALIDSRRDNRITNKLAMMFMLLAERNVNHRNFVRYHHLRPDLVAVGQLACVRGFTKFRPFKDKEKSLEWEETMYEIEYDHNVCNNSFAFFTTCIRHALFQYLKSEYNQSNIVNKARLEEGLDASFGYVDMIAEKEAEEALTPDEEEAKAVMHEGIEEMRLWDNFDTTATVLDDEYTEEYDDPLIDEDTDHETTSSR